MFLDVCIDILDLTIGHLKILMLNELLFLSLFIVQAHFIKDRRCNTARAVFELESEYKWALSGTPLQNRVGELYSLVCN
jgi:DNA repair protein RAD16